MSVAVDVVAPALFHNENRYSDRKNLENLSNLQALLKPWKVHIKFSSCHNSLVIVLVDILFATIWTAVDPMQFEVVEYVIKNGPTNELLIDQSCAARNVYVWLGINFTYKIILLLTMIVLSILTRDIPNQTFATTSLRVFSYLFSAAFIVGFCVYYIFRIFDPNVHGSIADYVVLCLLFNILVLVFLVFVVILPIFPVIQNALKRRKITTWVLKLSRYFE